MKKKKKESYASYSLKEYILYALYSLKGTMLGYQPSFCPHTRLPAFPLQSANWATSGGVREHSLLFDSLHLKTEYQTRKTALYFERSSPKRGQGLKALTAKPFPFTEQCPLGTCKAQSGGFGTPWRLLSPG